MTDRRIPRELLGHHQYQNSQYQNSRHRNTQYRNTANSVDPLGWCVIATTALLTWLLGPAVLAILATIGFAKYWRAWRSGRRDSQCILGDIRLVLVYLAALAATGTVATAMALG